MPRSRRNNQNATVTELLDHSVEQTVRKFLKNLVCGTWKNVFDKYEDIPTDDNDNEDYTEYDEDNPEQKEKIQVYLDHIDNAMNLWGAMVRKRNGLSFMETRSPSPRTNRESGAPRPRAGRHTPYIEFCMQTRPQIRAESPALTFGEVSKELGRRWKSLTPDEKAAFRQAPLPVEESPVAPDPQPDESMTLRMSMESDVSVQPVVEESMTLRMSNELSDDEEEHEQPSTQTERPPARAVRIVRDYFGMTMKDMTTDEKKAFKRYKGLDYNLLLDELDYNNIFVEESTPPNPQKQREIINSLMNNTFFALEQSAPL